MIPQETINQVLEKANIVDTISEFVALKKKGVNYSGCCPFHNEKTPSFVVSPVKGIYKCFGCGEGGNAIRFIEKHESLSFPEALKFLGAKYNIVVPEEEISAEEKAKKEIRESLKAANQFALDCFTNNIDEQRVNENSALSLYLKERELDRPSVDKFEIGYAYPGYQDFLSDAKKSGYKYDILVKASLLGEKNGKYYDYFRDRLMFPFMDLAGNVIGFTGRILPSKDSDQQAKYLNSHDSEIFKKGSAVFGLYQAKKAIIAADKCFLVEGNIDVVTLHRKKINNVVCGSGTALTVDQIKLIRRFTSNITVIYDGDKAGIKASFKNIDLLLQEGINVHAIALPDGEDPDSFARKMEPEKLAKWLHNNEKDFINFKFDLLKAETKNEPAKEAAVIKEILQSVAYVPDIVTRDRYKMLCIEKFKIDEKTVLDSLKKLVKKSKEVTKTDKPGWLGLEWAINAIKESGEVIISADIEKLNEQWEDENENAISWAGELSECHFQELKLLTSNITILDELSYLYKDNKVNPLAQLCITAFKMGFNVIVFPSDDESYSNVNTPVSFIDCYFKLAKKFIELPENQYDHEKVEAVITQAAELFSYSSPISLEINAKKYADCLGLKEADFKKIMKPFLEKQKSQDKLRNEVVDEGEMLELNPDRLPDYVDRDKFHKYGYFPYQNRKGEKVRYVFKTQNGGLEVIGNFYIEPLFHVYNQDPEKNRRVIKVNNAEQNRSYYMEMKSGNMIDFSSFKKMLFLEGGNVFTKGKANHHEIIMASIANQMKICWELEIFGQQPEGFWAWANAIYADGKVQLVDDLGLIEYKDRLYYSPAYSKIYSGLRIDNDKYENVRHFIYKENTKKTTFEEWASLMDLVYKLNDNGKWAILFSILATFKSDIFPIDRLFTSLFFIGPTTSGKSKIAVSCRSLFVKPEAPLFNLNSGSDAAFFTTLEKMRDVIIIFEEYNDNQISDTKFQGLKAAVYDVEGKQKRKDASSRDIDISKVNGVPLILGQEGPERDDGALSNRCIICNVPKKDDWSEEESQWLRVLKEKESEGLANILLEILKQREIIKEHYQVIQRNVYRDTKNDLTNNEISFETRILNTVSLFLAICKLWEEKVPQLKLPFTYKAFYEIAKAKIISQSEAITSTNRLSVFFETIELLLNRPVNGLTAGKEFKIESHKVITLQKNRKETIAISFERETRILYLRLNIIHPMYMDVRKNEGLKINNLLTYLHDNPCYLGSVKSTRFTWTEIQPMPDGITGTVKPTAREASLNTSAAAFDYEKVKEQFNLDMEKFIIFEGVQESKPAEDHPKLNFEENGETNPNFFKRLREKKDEEPEDNLPF